MRLFQQSLIAILLIPISASNATVSNVTMFNETSPGVFDLVNANTELSILNSLMDIIPSFRRSISNGNYTFLAVTDRAFQSFNKSNPSDFLIFQTDLNFLTDFLQGLVIRNMDLSAENFTERTFLQTSSGSTLRMDVVDGGYFAGTGFTNANLTSIFKASDGALAIADSIILPPPYISDVLRTMYTFPLPSGINLEDYANVVDSYYSITVFLPSMKAINDTLILLNHSNIELSQTVITSIMDIHLVPSMLYGKDLKFDKAQEITTGLLASTLIVNSGLSLSIAGQGNKALGQVFETDTIIRGGVVHWIDTILLPDLSRLMNLKDKNTTVYPDFN